jgi:hypothetical protein
LRRIKARIDTGADRSFISRAVAQEVGLPISQLTSEDLTFVTADDRDFLLCGKTNIIAHVKDPSGVQLAFIFGRYFYDFTLFVSHNTKISTFDAFIGRDLIHEHGLQKSCFFAALIPMPKDGKNMTEEEMRARREEAERVNAEQDKELRDEIKKKKQNRKQSKGSEEAAASASTATAPTSNL